MYNVIIIEEVEDIIRAFIDSYRHSLIDRFEDSGLYFEDIIIQNYQLTSQRFHEEILNKIEIIFSQEEIFGYVVDSDGGDYMYLGVENFRLKVFYREYRIEKIREIYQIEFHKK